MLKKKRLLALLLAVALVIPMMSGTESSPEELKAATETEESIIDENGNRYLTSEDELQDAVSEETSVMLAKSEKAEQEDSKFNDSDGMFAEDGTQIKDVDGNLLIPFDLAYPDVFESGEVEYDKEHALLKLEGEAAKLTKQLRACGFIGLEKTGKAKDGTWYIATISGTTDVVTAVKKARELDTVLMADYDYIYRTATVDEEENTLVDCVKDNQNVEKQWHLRHGHLQKTWKYMDKNGVPIGGRSSVVVAIIDTGVDYTHPDLKANMWVNTDEIPKNGIDDDKNGYVDDVYGADTIATDGDPQDDHGHGTHVAGIVGAVNNKLGVVGVAYNAKLMAVKAGQASGVFNQSDVAEAILYAYEMGADVINMSFGGTACSIAVQDALSTAYTRATLVAAAGNSGAPNQGTDYYGALPNYPGALSYVIGVMSVNENGIESGFTNWDAAAYNTVEYEVYAPGEKILSTLPNGKYGVLSGTSMAAPYVSGVAALLRSYYTDRDMYPSKFIAAQICATSEDTATCCNPQKHTVNGQPHNLPMIVNAYEAMTKLPKPEVNLHNYLLFDSKSIDENNNEDGVIDAGETVNIGAVLRNRWGMSKDTVVTIDALSDLGVTNPYVEIVDGSSNFEGVGTYSTKDMLTYDGQKIVGTEEPLVVKISQDCPNDYLIQLNVTITYKNGLDENDVAQYVNDKGSIEFWVRNGVVLPSQITEDTTLTKDNYYIISNNVYIPEGVTVTVEAGTKIQFWSDDPKDPYAETGIVYLNVAGEFITNGTPEESVEMFPSEMMDEYRVEIIRNGGYVELNYTTIINPYLNVNHINHCILAGNYDLYYYRTLNKSNLVSTDVSGATVMCTGKVSNSILKNLILGNYSSEGAFGQFEYCSFVNTGMHYALASDEASGRIFQNCVFMNNKSSTIEWYNLAKRGIDKIVKDSTTGTTYMMTSHLGGSFDTRENTGIRVLADVLGGDLACVETETEEQFLKTNSMYGVVGLMQGDKYWINGNATNDFLEFSNENLEWQKACFNYLKKEYYWTIGYETALLEIPASSTNPYLDLTDEDLDSNGNIVWTKELVEESYTNAMRSGQNNFQFRNNAILNNFNDTSTENWIRFSTSGTYLANSAIGVSGNYWGTTDKELIEKQIVDFDDYNTMADIVAGDYLTEAPSDTFPFVVDAYLLNADGERVSTVSNETVTFVAEFNRDMDTTVPLDVRFGSSDPYAEYQVEGNYVSPRRWEGTYTLKTTIENGNQVINISNGRAADDHFLALYDVPGRFQFKLDTTAAQALIMQGSASETGIQLTWTQDDFDTLAGYNVYRSDKEDGYYQRLNSTILNVDEKEFFDDTVEPGKVYYYNFTVVKTDLTESEPSGKITIMSMDTMAPDIYHSPVRTAYTGKNLVVAATITDNLQIQSAKLFYRTIGQTEWKSTEMTAHNSRYSGIISDADISTEGLEYYIEAFDGISYTYKGSADAAYQVTVKLAVDQNSLGDVDGNGVIEIKDALMLLQAANDRLNLTEDQFLRADIDGDQILSAAEALRILMYVNGKITSIQV